MADAEPQDLPTAGALRLEPAPSVHAAVDRALRVARFQDEPAQLMSQRLEADARRDVLALLLPDPE